MATLEFFFDCSSPWTYLAFHRIEEVASEADADLVWKPILVGGVFNDVNQSVYEQRANPVPAKLHYHAKDLKDWARAYGLEIGWPSIFPINSVRAMRGCLVADRQEKLPSFARAVFEAYWGRGEDIAREEVLVELAEGVGMDGGAFLEAIARPDVKQALRANTDELVARGGFGSPSIFVDGDDLYFGNDRLPLVREALARTR
jgi:2-hydroxychromene-2-carboxylate isomerase